MTNPPKDGTTVRIHTWVDSALAYWHPPGTPDHVGIWFTPEAPGSSVGKIRYAYEVESWEPA